MSFRRAIWADDSTVAQCTKCRVPFDYRVYKHHCRKCGLIFCHDCSRQKMIIPREELVERPPNQGFQWFQAKLPTEIISDEDNWRCPQRVCDPCSFQLKDLQSDLRQQVSRAYQETVVESQSNMPNMPSIDFYMENEIAKATTMLYNFKNTLGEEKIPRELLDIAKGVVFLTILKAGFMFTGRYGTGIVMSKLPDGRWSAPSALMLTGLGWGLQVGAEVTEVLLILSTDQAVNTFKSKAQVSVGAELGVSVGPIGRSIESDVTAGSKGAAHAFSYAQSKGLFFGASLEAAGIAARPDVNRAFYGEKISISSLLDGSFPPPKGAEPLYKAINEVLFEESPRTSRPRYVTPAGAEDVDDGYGRSMSNRSVHGSYNTSAGNSMAASAPPAPQQQQNLYPYAGPGSSSRAEHLNDL